MQKLHHGTKEPPALPAEYVFERQKFDQDAVSIPLTSYIHLHSISPIRCNLRASNKAIMAPKSPDEKCPKR